ncbi:MAG: alpha/beta hydrolase, partial [Bryobacteraceae bacterium]
HSMGGWVVAHTAAADSGLIGAVMISAGDMGRLGSVPREALVALMADDMESLAGVTAESMAEEIRTNAKAFGFGNTSEGLSRLPLLVLTSDDGYAPVANALVKAIEVNGGKKATSLHVATDHSWSDRRIRLESEILKWLADLR